MNFVEPIRDKKKIAQIKNVLRGQKRYRDLLLFTFGINTALRASDLVKLKVGDVLDEKRQIKDRFIIKEEKRNKRQEVIINSSIRAELQATFDYYPKLLEDRNNFLFFNTKKDDYKAAIKRGQVWKFINAICREVGLKGEYGSHSLRKSWGYHARMSGIDLALIMQKLNHNSLAYTKRYIGVSSDELAEVSRKLNL